MTDDKMAGFPRGAGTSMGRAYLGLAVLVLLTILSYTDRTIIILLVEPIKADLGINDVQFSLLTGLSFALFYALFGVPFGWLADRFSRRWIIYLGVSCWSIATVCCGLATTFPLLFAARTAVGVGEATLSPVGYALVGDMFPRRRLALAFGILGAGTALGSAVAYAVGGALISWANGHSGLWGLQPWQIAIVLVGLPGVLIAPLVFLVPKSADRATKSPEVAARAPGTSRPYLPWLRRNLSHLAPMTLGGATIYMLMFGAASWMPALLYRNFGLQPAEAGGKLAIALGISGLGFVLSGWLVDRLAASTVRQVHLRYMGMIILSIGLFGAVGFYFSTTVFQVLALMAVISFLAPINGPAMAYLQMHTPDEFRGRTIAIFLLIYNLLGMSAGPSVVALATHMLFDGDLAKGLAAICLACGIAGFLLFALARMKEPRVFAEA